LQALSILSRQDGAAETGPLGAGDADRGEAIFERRCTGCHALDANHEGPHLRGVYGRKAGSVADFRYSTALKGSNFTWNDTLINQWLTDPDAMLPGNNMDFRVVKASERADLVAFLKQLK
jgi:cytochrome c